ncbi:unnamed protein product, partial [Allacma fusca]
MCDHNNACAQCLPKCIWVAFEDGDCACMEALINAKDGIVGLRSGTDPCQGFELFCRGPAEQQHRVAQVTGPAPIIFMIVLLLVILFAWLFNNILDRLRVRIRRIMYRGVRGAWRQGRRMWGWSHSLCHRNRVPVMRDWHARYNGSGRDPSTFFRDLVDLSTRMDSRNPADYNSPGREVPRTIAMRPQPPRPRCPPPSAPKVTLSSPPPAVVPPTPPAPPISPSSPPTAL